MQKLLPFSVLSLVFFSGCTTTQDLVNKVSAGSHATPLTQILNERTDLRKNLSTVEIRQYFDRVENPSVAEVKVTEAGLMDDSVNAIRTIYKFKLVDQQWMQVSSSKEYQCARQGSSKNFQKTLCP